MDEGKERKREEKGKRRYYMAGRMKGKSYIDKRKEGEKRKRNDKN